MKGETGTKMSEVIHSYKQYVMPTYMRQPVAFVRGEGCYLYDEDGQPYLDFVSGISMNNLGHCHPAVVRAIQEQAAQLIHTCNLYFTAAGARLAELISTNSIGGKVFFSNSGAEANECAIKLARKYGRDQGGESKYKIVSLLNGFHGRTMATLTATAQPEKQEPFKPLLPGFEYAVPNDASSLAAVMNDDVCAILMEPVQGESGVWPLSEEFMAEARRLADKHAALLIFDEIQTGMGRTGELFAFEHFKVEPDVMTLAKSLGGAMPIGATVASEKYSEVLSAGLHGSTFGGGPVPCAAGAAVFNQLMAPGFLESVKAKGGYMKDRLNQLKTEGAVAGVRGLGLMLAIDLKQQNAAQVVGQALEQKLMLNNTSAGTIRFLPPLVVEKDMIDQVIDFLRSVL